MFEDDFDYFVNFIKENNNYYHLINFDEIMKLKSKVCKVDNVDDFAFNIKNLIIKKYLPLDLVQHFSMCCWKNLAKIYEYLGKNNPWYKFFKKYEGIYYVPKFKSTSKKIKTKSKIYDFKIINHNDKKYMYIRIKDMIIANDEELEKLKKWIIKNKDLEMIYNWLYGGNKSNNCAACYINAKIV